MLARKSTTPCRPYIHKCWFLKGKNFYRMEISHFVARQKRRWRCGRQKHSKTNFKSWDTHKLRDQLTRMLEQKHYKMTQSKRLFSRSTALLILPIATTMSCNECLVDHKTPSLLFMPFYSASALAPNSRT